MHLITMVPTSLRANFKLVVAVCQVVGHVKVGSNVTMMPTSVASHGTVVPDGYILTPGTTSQRLPSGPSGGHGGCFTQLRKVCELVADLAAASAADDCGPPPYLAGIYNYNI
jgi:hypothetical protein